MSATGHMKTYANNEISNREEVHEAQNEKLATIFPNDHEFLHAQKHYDYYKSSFKMNHATFDI